MPTDWEACFAAEVARLASCWLETEAAWPVASLEGALALALQGLAVEGHRRRVALPLAQAISLGAPITDVVASVGWRCDLLGTVDRIDRDQLSRCRATAGLLLVGAPARPLTTPAEFTWAMRHSGKLSILFASGADAALGLADLHPDLIIAPLPEGAVIAGRSSRIRRLATLPMAAISRAASSSMRQAQDRLRDWLEHDASLHGQIAGNALAPGPFGRERLSGGPDATLRPAEIALSGSEITWGSGVENSR